MKTIRKLSAVLFLTACALILYSAVLYASAPEAAGRYEAAGCAKDGTDYNYDGEYILLNEDGTGEILFNEVVYKLNWELTGDIFSFTDEDGEKSVGTLAGGVINVNYLDYDYIYIESDSSLSGAIDAAEEEDAADIAEDAGKGEKETETAAAFSQNGTGQTPSVEGGPTVYYANTRESSGSLDGDEEGDPTWRSDYIALNEDGTGVFLFNQSAFFIRWEQEGDAFSFTDHLNREFKGTMTSGRIEGTYGRYRYTFDQVQQTLPAYALSPEDWGKNLPVIMDEAEVLSDAQEQELTQKAQDLADQYDVGVYVTLVGSRDDYTWSGNISTLSEELRAGYAIGIGTTQKKEKHIQNTNTDWKDSILLTVAVQERKYDICVSGDYANWAFPVYGREMIRDAFLDDLKGNEWAEGVRDFLDGADDVLKVAAKGKQISFKNDTTGRLIGIFVPAILALLFGYGIAAMMRGSMQNTQKANNAAEYVAGDRVAFTNREDRYIRTLVSRTYSPQQKSDSGSGGGSFSSSSGSSHTSGSF